MNHGLKVDDKALIVTLPEGIGIDTVMVDGIRFVREKAGEWLECDDDRFVKCSACGLKTTKASLWGIAIFGEDAPRYCPDCGARMEEATWFQS